MIPQLRIYLEIYKRISNLGYDVYDYLPNSEASYPFVHIGEMQSPDRYTKTSVFGEVYQTINIYHHYKNMGDLMNMSGEVKAILRGLQIPNMKLILNDIDEQILNDSTTSEVLKRSLIEVHYTFY